MCVCVCVCVCVCLCVRARVRVCVHFLKAALNFALSFLRTVTLCGKQENFDAS